MRPLLLGFLGGLAAIILAAAIGGAALWRYHAAAPDRERAALEADIDTYDAWYRENTYRRNLGDAYYLPYRDRFMEQHPRLKQYTLWWQDARTKQPNGGSAYNLAITQAMRPEDVRDPAMLDAYLAR